MTSPFESGRNAEVFNAILDLRFEEWARLRRNLLARRRYAAKRRAAR